MDLINLKSIKYFLLDMDGTIYLDNTLIPGTLDFLDTIQKQNKRVFYITNNSSKSVTDYVDKLSSLKISSSETDFCTSAQALVYNLDLCKDGGKKLFLLGTPSLRKYLEESGYTIVTEYTEDINLRPDYVILAFDTGITYEKLQIASYYLSDGVTYWATHPDVVCPVDGKHSTPDAGAFISFFETATGRTPSFIAGKPNSCMIDMIIEKMNCSRSEVAVVGDRLHTDILSAINAKVTSICVLSGETTIEQANSAKLNQKPDYILPSIKELNDILRS